jgi:hypothetical protein
MPTLSYKVTSEQPCQIQGLGEFEAGQTMDIDEMMLHMFELHNGCKLGAAKLPKWVTVSVILGQDEESEAAND